MKRLTRTYKKSLAMLYASVLMIGTLGTMAGCKSETQTAMTAQGPSDQDISDAYIYLLGRLIVLRQERLDFEKEGFEWNKIIYHAPGGVAWANPNLDVGYSEAWVAVDDNTCVQLEIPKVTGRYYTWHMLNGWGETLLNINERTYPQKPNGKYALCLKGSSASVPADALRIDLPSKTSRVLSRVELATNPKEAVRLQHGFKLTPLGDVKVEAFPKIAVFENTSLPGAEAFDDASAILASDTDINEGMAPLQAKVKAVEAYVKTGPEARARVNQVIKSKALPEFMEHAKHLGLTENGWTRGKQVGNYGNDYTMRTVTDFEGLWANNSSEATYFGIAGLDGGKTFTQTFPKDELPKTEVRYFWSVIVVDGKEYKVIPNPLNRFLLNKYSPLKYNPDGSLTLVYSPTRPTKYPVSNWLPTKAGENYNFTFRFYGPSKDVTDGKYFPPALQSAE